MKIRLIAVAVLCALSVPAYAQSSVTLYGFIDEGLDFTNNAGGKQAYQMVSGNTAGSRWGLKGNEDLGGGLSAIFKLESGYNINTGAMGQGGLLFGRSAYVGLSSHDYGTFTMGRQYDPTVDMWSGYTAAGNWAGDLTAHPYDNDNGDWGYRIQNGVKYLSPTFGGFSGEAMYAFSNVTGGFSQNNLYSAAAQYHAGSFSAAVAYMKINNPGANSGGALPTATTIFTGASQQNIDAGFSYAFGSKAIVSFAYSRTNIDNPVSNSFFSTQPAAGSQSSWKFDNFEVNAQYFIKYDLWVGAVYTYTQAHVDTVSGNSVPKWNQVALEANYDLSKLTSVYIQGAYQHANGNTGENFDYADIVGAPSHSSTDNQILYRIAMIHRF